MFLILVVLLLIFFHYINLSGFFRAPFIFFQRNFFSRSLKIKNFFEFFSSKKELMEENENLKKINQELLLENKDLKISREENKILAEQMDFLKKKDYNYVLSRVVGKTSVDPFVLGNLILDKGADDGIKEGYPAIVNQGFLAGKIIKVEKDISYLNIILDNQSMIAASAGNDAEGIVKGEHQLSLVMDFILPDKKIEPGDLAVTSGLESLIPKGLAIGKIREIKFNPGDFFQKAILDPLIDFDNLQIVSILIPYENN